VPVKAVVPELALVVTFVLVSVGALAVSFVIYPFATIVVPVQISELTRAFLAIANPLSVVNAAIFIFLLARA
jgi:hypothetical protein